MKRWYQLHIMSLVLMLLLGSYFTYELSLSDRMGAIHKYYNVFERIFLLEEIIESHAICSLFSIAVGWKTVFKLQKTGLVLLFVSVTFLIKAIFMINAPAMISLKQALGVCLVYSISAISCSIYVLLKYETEPILVINYKDEILDEGME